MLLPYLAEHYGDIASVAGLLVTFVGFFATLNGVRKAKRAAEEARLAAREAVSRIKTQLLADEIAASLRFVREIDLSCREHRWTEAIDRCDGGRTSLARMRDDPRLADSERNAIIMAVRFIGEFIPYLQQLRKAIPPRDISSQKAKRLHEIIAALSQAQGRLQSEVLEV